MGQNQKILAPSILAANHAYLLEGLEAVKEAGCQWIHLDIMDGHFAPNLSFGPQTIKELSKYKGNLFFDTHLMLDNPDKFIDPFIDAGSDLISIHVEADCDVAGTLDSIKEKGIQAGIVLNPSTPANEAIPYLSKVDLVLVMTVWPGFGGQSFIKDTLGKIKDLNQLRKNHDYSFRLEVDGGINRETAIQCADQGVDTFVAGTAFFKDISPSDFRENIES